MVLSLVEHKEECIEVLKKSGMFAKCSKKNLQYFAERMERQELKKNSILWKQSELLNHMIVVAKGRIRRLRDIEGQIHIADCAEPGHTIGSHHFLTHEPSSATCRCDTDVVLYKLSSEVLLEAIHDPSIAKEIIHGLSVEVRHKNKLLQTPLLEQRPKPTPYFAISVAAAIESFYRSALNASLNAKLTGQPAAAFFPNMGVQAPTRIVYINGFKGIRHFLDQNINADDCQYPSLTRLGLACTPGVLMTPVSSILEACNAGHMNAEPLQSRWVRGLIPRGIREIIFGIGINQLSDYFEERIPYVENPVFRNACGSVIAGIIAGYFSHVPHNISTLKLVNPSKTYMQHFADLAAQSESRIPTSFSPRFRKRAAGPMVLLCPKGLGIRTTQIVGSFIILNGTINSLKDFDPRKYLPTVGYSF